jgi:hypothetical protein
VVCTTNQRHPLKHTTVTFENMPSDPVNESKDEEDAAAPTVPIAEEPPTTRTGMPT